MRKLMIFPFLIFPFLITAQRESLEIADSVKIYLDKSLGIIESTSHNSDNINWNQLREDLYYKARGSKTLEDLLPLYPYIFEQIDDHQGTFIHKNISYSWKKKSGIKVNATLKNAIKKYTKVRSQKMGEDIGYILIPGNDDLDSKQTDRLISEIKNAVGRINAPELKAWIIDLRVNTGGNVYAMMAGLTELIGEGRVGGFMNPARHDHSEWLIKDGAFYVDSINVSKVKYEGYPFRKNLPVAILLSGSTASAGEMTAINFIGRPNSILIGESTAGFANNNLEFKLDEFSSLNLAVEYASDRNGIIYPKGIVPDIKVSNGDNFEILSHDEKIKKAISWLKKKC